MIRVNSVLSIFIEKKFERILTKSKFFVNKFMFFMKVVLIPLQTWQEEMIKFMRNHCNDFRPRKFYFRTSLWENESIWLHIRSTKKASSKSLQLDLITNIKSSVLLTICVSLTCFIRSNILYLIFWVNIRLYKICCGVVLKL